MGEKHSFILGIRGPEWGWNEMVLIWTDWLGGMSRKQQRGRWPNDLWIIFEAQPLVFPRSFEVGSPEYLFFWFMNLFGWWDDQSPTRKLEKKPELSSCFQNCTKWTTEWCPLSPFLAHFHFLFLVKFLSAFVFSLLLEPFYFCSQEICKFPILNLFCLDLHFIFVNKNVFGHHGCKSLGLFYMY